MERVKFVQMVDGDAADYALLSARGDAYKAAHFVDNVVSMLKSIGVPDYGYHIDRYQHCLQSATLALRDGQDEETVVAALLHDIGDLVSPDNHADLAAAILQPYVSEKTHWIIRHHAIFQGVYFWHHIGWDQHARERHRGHPWFEDCARFCERYDQNAFDPNYDTLPLEAFLPSLHRILGRAPFAWAKPEAA